MPTLLLQDGFKFFFYANEHEPKHIHVSKGDDYARINLSSLEVTRKYMKQSELKKVLKILKIYQREFERKWDEYFSR